MLASGPTALTHVAEHAAGRTTHTLMLMANHTICVRIMAKDKVASVKDDHSCCIYSNTYKLHSTITLSLQS